MQSVVVDVELQSESRSDGISTRAARQSLPTKCRGRGMIHDQCRSFRARNYGDALPGVSFAMRTLPQAKNCHRVRDSIADCSPAHCGTEWVRAVRYFTIRARRGIPAAHFGASTRSFANALARRRPSWAKPKTNDEAGRFRSRFHLGDRSKRLPLVSSLV